MKNELNGVEIGRGIRECSLYEYQIDSLPEVRKHTCFIKEPL